MIAPMNSIASFVRRLLLMLVSSGLPCAMAGEIYVIANADTVMRRDNASLVAEVFPNVPIKGSLSPNGTLLSIDKAKRMLDYNPQHSWRNHV